MVNTYVVNSFSYKADFPIQQIYFLYTEISNKANMGS